MAPFRRTLIVEGPLAFQMRRLVAARTNDSGLQIFNLPQVAARFAGGFLYPVTPDLLEPAIKLALEQGGFAELDAVRELPGITRAVARTLRHAWNADIDLRQIANRDGAARLSDLAIIEQRVRGQIPSAVMLPRDIRDVALEHAHRAPASLGPVRIELLSWIAPLWRSLLNYLCKMVPVEWEAPEGADADWFSGAVRRIPALDGTAKRDLVSCADPHHEVIEALRWVRNLISTGAAGPGEIALAAAHPEAWDEHFLALAADTGIRIHFSHGVPALSTRDGQRCAALADLLLRGLSEARVRRLVTLCRREGGIVDRLPANWLGALPRGATLLTLGDWQRACEGILVDGQPFNAKAVLLPWLAMLEIGPAAARDAAASTLEGRARRIWDAATRSAPAHAIELTLQNIRLPAETDAGDSVVWCPAAHLASSPRSRVRLLGLTSRAWPRRGGEDPILPDHLVSARDLDPDPVPETDRRNFSVISASARVELALSRNRRSPQGSRVGPSPLLPHDRTERALPRARIPEHAFSEADRLMARPAEATSVPYIASASQCWRNWHSENFTAHDGRYSPDHPVITRALTRTQSATSLQLLLRGPLGFVWKYALGWRAPEYLQQPLTIAPTDFGKLVHELLRRTVDALEPTPGFAAATKEEIESAMAAAAQTVRETWPIKRPVPPRLLWSNTVDHGARMAIAALSEEITQTDTRSWTEVPFGDATFSGGRALPWDATIPVVIPNTDIRIQGAIDRLDLRTASHAVRVTDYKTGRPPQASERIVIGGGTELQRSLYALACRQLLPDIRHIMARLAYLSDPPLVVRLEFRLGCLCVAGKRHGAPGPRRGFGNERPAPRHARIPGLSAPQGRKVRASLRPALLVLGRTMSPLPDEHHRKRALTDLGATLLVEAAAGTGKTSLLAGRVLVLLGASVPPRDIAAITFTEFAAGELRDRVTQYLNELLAGRVPAELRLAFDTGLTQTQRAALEQACTRLDELTCTTIHGFCYDLLRTYAVEAAIDPGAEILDSVQTDLAFGSIFEQWLRGRLDNAQSAADPIALVAQINPIEAEKLLRAFAECRRAHRTARPLAPDLDRHAEVRFVDGVTEFRRWFNGTAEPREAAQDISELEQLAGHFRGRFDPLPGFDCLWQLAHPPHVAIMRRHGLDLQRYQRRGVWQRTAGGDQGKRLADEAAGHYEQCADAFRELIGRIATGIISAFSVELDGLLAAFESFKRSAAVLDFDDLLYTTREVLRHNEPVRRAASGRFQRFLVDEFQDTDPIQAEIVFLLTATAGHATHWYERRLLPGRLFMVGDPKQAIYRFRGVDIATYLQARDAVERQFPGNVVRVSSNFRSCGAILQFINRCFEAPLGAQETGYVALEATRGNSEHGLPCVAKIKVDVIPQSRIDGIRDDEASIVAETCARLIGNVLIRRAGAAPRPLAPGDIALLAPIGRELWRYERALEEAGLPFSSQAGKNLFRRQEVQDLVALVRTLADSRDTLALGALLRGPLVGLTEQELLDITAVLPAQDGNERLPAGVSLRTDPSIIAHPVAHHTLTILRDLRRRVGSTAPSLLIAEAVERLRIRAILVARSADQASRALANVDALIERARAYGVRGFLQFARDLDADWARRTSLTEGVVDAEGQSIDIVTIHSSKGLEWPVVIPINMASTPRSQESFVHRRTDDTVHWMLGDIIPPTLAGALQSEAQEEAQQRLRLLYVACTRAMDLLVVPELSWSDAAAWARAVDFRLGDVPELDIAAFRKKPFVKAPEAPNAQTAQVFAEEASALGIAFERIAWVHPSEKDQDTVQFEMSSVAAWEQPTDALVVTGGGSIRGNILHKLMEELLAGELQESPEAARERAAQLIRQLAPAGPPAGLEAQELAHTALRTFALPELAADRGGLVPEVPVYGCLGGNANRLVSGRADAVRYRDGRARIVFDWKSDVAPEPATCAAYARQLSIYVDVLGAERGAVIYMTTGQIDWVDPSRRAGVTS